MPEARELRSVIEAAEQAASGGDYVTAEVRLREAAALQEAQLGPFHPDLANTLNNLGVIYERADSPAEAELCYRRAYAIATTALEPNHPFVATSRQNLEDFCKARGRPFDRSVVPRERAALRNRCIGPRARLLSARLARSVSRCSSSPRSGFVHQDLMNLHPDQRVQLRRATSKCQNPRRSNQIRRSKSSRRKPTHRTRGRLTVRLRVTAVNPSRRRVAVRSRESAVHRQHRYPSSPRWLRHSSAVAYRREIGVATLSSARSRRDRCFSTRA
jgi:hypothetical protein